MVEDEANIAEYLLIGLREEGYVVEHAADGLIAWQRLQAGSWDLVLLDWSLPGLDGLEVLRLFRERDRRTPVLFLDRPRPGPVPRARARSRGRRLPVQAVRL